MIFLSFDKSKHNFTKNAVMTRYIIYTQEKNVSLFAYVVQIIAIWKYIITVQTRPRFVR